MKILCLTPVKHLAGVYEYLESLGVVDYCPDLNASDFCDLDMKQYNVILCNPNKQNYYLDESLLDKFQGKLITASTGVNHIDIQYCSRVGIDVISNAKDYALLNELPSTAELAFGLILSLLRNIPSSFDSVKQGQWNYEDHIGNQLYEKTVGIIGYGRLGKMMSNYCSAFGANVNLYDPYEGYSDLKSLLINSDIVTLHVHSTHETINMIDDDFIKSMKEGSILINTSRGEIVDEDSILYHLKTGHLAGYGADVISDEYGNRNNSPILSEINSKLNLIITPHIGGMTFEGQRKAYIWTIDKLKEICND